MNARHGIAPGASLILGAFAIVGSGLACGDPSAADPPTNPDEGTLLDIDAPAAEPAIDWVACGTRLECAEIQVPLDHDDPGGPTLPIALTRVPAWAGVNRLGSIVVNPGGPGAPGTGFAEVVDSRRVFGMLRGFDLVGFDPRGVGGSGAVSCGNSRRPSRAYAAGGVDELVRLYADNGADCAARMGALFDHLGSHDVVRDMDRIREALGEAKLNFIGVSYGTRLGALYAETFPERVRAILLDAPVSPVADMVEGVEYQFQALVDASREFVQDCQSGVVDCPAGVEAVVDDLWEHAKRTGSESLFAGLWQRYLAQEEGREALAELLDLYAVFPELWDDLVDGGGGPLDAASLAELSVNQTVHCTDDAYDPPSLGQLEALLEDYRARAPGFAPVTLPVATCAGWPAPSRPVSRLRAVGAAPLLVVAGEHDVLTPLAEAEAMHAALEDSRLVVSGHYGHGAMLTGSRCVDDLVDAYFTDLALPSDGTTCP